MSQNILNERRECRTNLVGTHVAIRAEGKKGQGERPCPEEDVHIAQSTC